MGQDKRHAATTIAAAAVSAQRFVSYGGAHASSSDDVLGVSEQAAAVGRAVSLITTFSAEVEAAEPIADGAYVRPAADGSGRAANGTIIDNCGRARGAASAGGLAEVVLAPLQGPRMSRAQAAVVAPVVVATDFSAASAAANAAAIQAAMDAVALLTLGGGVVRVTAGGKDFPLGATLRIADRTTLEIIDGEPKAFGVIGNMLTTKAYQSAGTAVTVAWSAGLVATVTWASHGLTNQDFCWLNRADQGQFCGVFAVTNIIDANNFQVALRRLPTTAPTGSIVARKAHESVRVIGGTWNYNASGGNTGSGASANAMVLAGVNDLQVLNVKGKDTLKYLVAVGAVANYKLNAVGGDLLASDNAKIYGPAFNGECRNTWVGSSGDDIISLQTKEPAAFVAQDFCHGDILGIEIYGVSGKTTTSGVVLYLSPFGVIDGVKVEGVDVDATAGAVRIETLYATGTSEVGTVKMLNINPATGQHVLVCGNGANPMTMRKVTVENPRIRNAGASAGRGIAISGSQVSGNIEVVGGYLAGNENLVNNASTGTVTVTYRGTRVGAQFVAARMAATSGTLNLNFDSVEFEVNPTTFLNNNGGSPTINLRMRNCITPADLVVSLTGTPTLNVFAPDMRFDVGATGFNKTTIGQECINTSAGGARGTLVAGQPVICNGTNWLQKTALANLF